jgi:hypothetical protein
MVRTAYVFTLSMIFLVALSITPAIAGEKFSCDDLDSIGEGLSEVLAAYDATPSIEEGSEADNILADMINDLHTVAAIEKDTRLDRAVANLDEAWHDMDGDAFRSSLVDTIDIIASIFNRDC